MKRTNKLTALATAVAIALGSATSAVAYPVISTHNGAAGSATVRLQVTQKGWRNLIVSGVAVVAGKVIRDKSISLSIKQPNKTVISAGQVTTDANGNYKVKVQKINQQTGVYRITVTFRGASTTIAIPVK